MRNTAVSRVRAATRGRALAASLALGVIVVTMTTPMRAAAVASGPAAAPATSTASATSSPVPAGFSQTQLLHGLKDPSVFAFAPNGDIYIGEQSGVILLYRNGLLLPTPVVSLNANNVGETGLLGMALDPNFAVNGYLYVSYTAPVTFTSGVVHPLTQLSRFTVLNGTASLASERIFLRGNQIQNLHHAGNDLKVGPDDKLWWSVGDNDPSLTNAQTLANIYGKILRLNLDGTVPADNPFVNVPGATPYIYALGLRNPFRFTFLPDGRAMTADTGSSFWEELDTIQSGGNYGWPFYEGQCFNCGYLDPSYAYGHLPVDGAVSAVAAYSGTSFPEKYRNVVFVGDYNRTDIEAVQFDSSYSTEISHTVFDSAAGTIADLQQGPDGALYFVSIFEGTFSKITAIGPFPPTAVATATPQTGPAPLTVVFSSAGSTDPHGQPLGYAWDFGDGSAPSNTPNPTHTYVAGAYTATLTVTGGTGGTQTATTTTPVVAGHTPPSVAINSPATYSAGDLLSFSGTATDPADGTLPPGAYTWQVDYITHGVPQPFYLSEAPHPFYGPVSGSTTGSVLVQRDISTDPTSFYRITLTVVDSLGLTTTVTKDVAPTPASWSTTASVPGAAYYVDGLLTTGARTVTDRSGITHVLAGLPVQNLAGIRYRFQGWSDGSALTDSFSSAAQGSNHVADYTPVTSTLPSAWTSVDVGAPLKAGTADYDATDQSFYVDGSGSDVTGTKDQFHYVYQIMPGDGTITARVRYQTDSDPWAKAGLMIKQAAQAGATFVDAIVTPDVAAATPNINGVGCTLNGCLAPLPPVTPTMGHGVRMQYSNAKSVTAPTLPGYAAPSKWLKLQRTGGTFKSWESVDGQTWTLVGTVNVAMTGPVTIGMFVTSHDVGQFSNAAFDHVQVSAVAPVAGPWSDSDVGSPAVAGSSSFDGSAYTVNGAGADIWGTIDQFHYVHQAMTGNGTMIARLTSLSDSSTNAKAGVMFKQSTAAGSSYLLIGADPNGQVKVQYNFNGSVGAGTYTYPNIWMKLTRAVGTFTAYLSGDGFTWTKVAVENLTTTDPATVGLFTCSHNSKVLGTATFDHVSFTSGP
ncbi:PQQ-dependent sugar dehydrogenase [Nakamurella sp. PAMC28650]|uniref:PQQ-dependent sugar dehydrogenase n=1 Tax=Nakamurella sp. PAMC28650 TaxID=2762325 RepID=UPI00164D6470|nr:PQQ-dependent sugar dehydrogenase [Nakamurella sp. PAMC28650]QNK81544.1 PQQ-dependent sugar dehydrogenase [Nakamurella sp. PAMC28650]